MLRARHIDFPVNDRRCARNREQLRIDVSPFEHLDQQVGIPLETAGSAATFGIDRNSLNPVSNSDLMRLVYWRAASAAPCAASACGPKQHNQHRREVANASSHYTFFLRCATGRDKFKASTSSGVALPRVVGKFSPTSQKAIRRHLLYDGLSCLGVVGLGMTGSQLPLPAHQLASMSSTSLAVANDFRDSAEEIIYGFD